MTKIPAAAAAAILLCLFNTPDARGCDEYCAEAHEEATYERAYAREEAAENGYFVEDRRSSRASRHAGRREQESVVAPPAVRQSARSQNAAQPAPVSVERATAMNENSSITTDSTAGATRVAGDESMERKSTSREVGCKSFFPSVGMTLSVPCD